jgi:hypothetical protein
VVSRHGVKLEAVVGPRSNSTGHPSFAGPYSSQLAKPFMLNVGFQNELITSARRWPRACRNDAAATFTRRALDAVAELERAMTAARTRAALRSKRARGERRHRAVRVWGKW